MVSESHTYGERGEIADTKQRKKEFKVLMGIKLLGKTKEMRSGFYSYMVTWCFHNLPANPEHKTAIAMAQKPNNGFCSTCNCKFLKLLLVSATKLIQQSKEITTNIHVARPDDTCL